MIRVRRYAELARSINHMADQLRKDNERLAIIYEKQSQFFADDNP